MSGWFWKPFLSAAFLVFAWKMGAFATPYGRMIFVALSLSWLGDVIPISKPQKTFLFGLLAFLFAHIAYGVAFLKRGFDPSWATIAWVLLVIVNFAVSLWLIPAVRKNAPKMTLPVVGYMTVILVMVGFAAGATGASGDLRILIGALMFYVSDLAVARNKFVAPGWINRAWGLPLYYAAQLVLAATVRY